MAPTPTKKREREPPHRCLACGQISTRHMVVRIEKNVVRLRLCERHLFGALEAINPYTPMPVA